MARVDVTNTGERSGQEVVQLYVADSESSLQKPPKELEAFQKVTVEPGQTVTVELLIDARSLQHYDPQLKSWCVEPGVFDVLVGTSSADLPLRATFTARGPNPYAYGPSTAIVKLFADPRAREVLAKYLLAPFTSPGMAHLLLEFMPDMPLARVMEGFMGGLAGIDTEPIKSRLYAELGEIEV